MCPPNCCSYDTGKKTDETGSQTRKDRRFGHRWGKIPCAVLKRTTCWPHVWQVFCGPSPNISQMITLEDRFLKSELFSSSSLPVYSLWRAAVLSVCRRHPVWLRCDVRSTILVVIRYEGKVPTDIVRDSTRETCYRAPRGWPPVKNDVVVVVAPKKFLDA